MVSELTQAIQQVCEDKKIPIESVVSTIESALAAAYRKDFGNKLQNVQVDFDVETGNFQVHDLKEVTEDKLKDEYEEIREKKNKIIELEEEDKHDEANKLKEELQEEFEKKESAEKSEEIKKFNPKTMISLSEAKERKKDIKIGDELREDLPVGGDFGRMAAQTAKQVIIQKLREAERDIIYEEYKDKVGDLLNGTVQRVEGRNVLIDLGGVTANLPLDEGLRNERYNPGMRFKFYVKNVEQTPKGPKIILSRTHPDILRKLFKLEVPEIASGTVQIKSIAREAGSRSKIAVVAKDDNIDPIGSCVGQRGTRVQTIINEIGGEKIDIIEWEEDPAKFIAKALSPAKIVRVDIMQGNEQVEKDKLVDSAKPDELSQADLDKDEPVENDGQNKQPQERKAVVCVTSDQLSLAIGKEGQNVRLAAKLTGWKIDIVEEKIKNTQAEQQSGNGVQLGDEKEDSEQADEQGGQVENSNQQQINNQDKSTKQNDEDIGGVKAKEAKNSSADDLISKPTKNQKNDQEYASKK